MFSEIWIKLESVERTSGVNRGTCQPVAFDTRKIKNFKRHYQEYSDYFRWNFRIFFFSKMNNFAYFFFKHIGSWMLKYGN